MIQNRGDRTGLSSRPGSRRNKAEKWIMESNFATLNVCGRMKDKMNEVYELVDKKNIDILCLTETKRKGSGISYDPITSIWSGSPEGEHACKGVGMVLSDRMSKCMTGFECVNPRLIWVRMKVGLVRLFILGVYAPDMTKPLNERNEFWEAVRDILNKCESNERIIMLGDCNGWVGRQRYGYESVLGMYGDDKVNENGLSLLDICMEMNLSVTNTLFDHKKIHMYTWHRGEQRSIIDLVIVDERLKHKVVDTRVYRGVCVGPDHYLVVSRFRNLFRGWRHRPQVSTTECGRIKVDKLQDMNVKEEYKQKLKEKLKNEHEYSEIENIWDVMKKSMVETATEVCGMNKKRRKKKLNAEWWDDDVRRCVDEKKKAWLDLLSSQSTYRMYEATIRNDEIERKKRVYGDMKRKVKMLVDRKKQELKEKYDRRLGDNFRDNTKLFWSLVNQSRKKSVKTNLKGIKNDSGNIVNDEKSVLECWKNYFESVFETEEVNVSGTNNVIDELSVLEDEKNKIGVEEIIKAMKSMKAGKATGYDKVSIEMLRAGDEIIVRLLCRLFNKCYEHGRVPNDWCKAVIVPLYKGKGSQQDCKSYRGISLLSIVGKLYAKVLSERVMYETEEKIWNAQAGFRKGMGCTDQVFSLRCLTQHFLAKNQKIFCAFVDLEKAYDKVLRDELWKTLITYGVNGRLLQALKSLYVDSSACIRIGDALSDWFDISRGVRQGCVASPWLFNLYMDSCMHELKENDCGLKLGDLSVKCLVYADDQVLLASSKDDLQNMLTCMNESLKKKSMKMNVSKTKVMVFDRMNEDTKCDIMIENVKVEQVKEFLYLGSMFTADGRCESDIERRAMLGNKVNGALHTLIVNKNLSTKVRLAIHNSVLVPTLAYGSESWVWQKKHESRINAVEMRSLRSMCGVCLNDKIKNEVIRDCCNIKEDVVMRIEKGMLRWFGHMQRMNESRLVKQIYGARVEGHAVKGRPRKSFNDQINDILRKGEIRSTRNRRLCMRRLMSVEEAKEVCQDRGKWRTLVSAYPYGRQA